MPPPSRLRTRNDFPSGMAESSIRASLGILGRLRGEAEVPAHLACTDEMREHPVVPVLVPDLASDDCGMDLERLGKVDHRHRRRGISRGARLPDLAWDQRLLGTLVGLRLLRVPLATLHVSYRQVVTKNVATPLGHVAATGGQFTHKKRKEL